MSVWAWSTSSLEDVAQSHVPCRQWPLLTPLEQFLIAIVDAIVDDIVYVKSSYTIPITLSSTMLTAQGRSPYTIVSGPMYT